MSGLGCGLVCGRFNRSVDLVWSSDRSFDILWMIWLAPRCFWKYHDFLFKYCDNSQVVSNVSKTDVDRFMISNHNFEILETNLLPFDSVSFIAVSSFTIEIILFFTVPSVEDVLKLSE
jgi:hypothetical protein